MVYGRRRADGMSASWVFSIAEVGSSMLEERLSLLSHFESHLLILFVLEKSQHEHLSFGSVLTLGLLTVALSAAFDSSTCIDTSGFERWFKSADSALTSCISNNCGRSVCVKSCNNDLTCVLQKCPDLGLDCVHRLYFRSRRLSRDEPVSLYERKLYFPPTHLQIAGTMFVNNNMMFSKLLSL